MTTHLKVPAPDAAPVSSAGTAPPAVRQAPAPAEILTRKAIPAILVAAGGALAYSISKIDLALRGELGLPGFTAPAASYRTHDAFTGQLANAGLGLAMAVGILLLAVPKRRWLQIVLLVLNGAGALMIAVSTVLFAARALGIAPALGTPAEGVSTWLSVGVGLIWSVAWWIGIVHCAHRRARDRK